MSVLTALRAHLINNADIMALTGDRVYAGMAATAATLPYIAIHEISRTHERHVRAACGMARSRYQLDCWAATAAAADTIREHIRDALDHYVGTLGSGSETVTARGVFLENDFLGFDWPTDASETPTRRAVLEFQIVHNETVPTLA